MFMYKLIHYVKGYVCMAEQVNGILLHTLSMTFNLLMSANFIFNTLASKFNDFKCMYKIT